MDFKNQILKANDHIAELKRKIQLWHNCIGEEATGYPVGSTVKIECSPNLKHFPSKIIDINITEYFNNFDTGECLIYGLDQNNIRVRYNINRIV